MQKRELAELPPHFKIEEKENISKDHHFPDVRMSFANLLLLKKSMWRRRKTLIHFDKKWCHSLLRRVSINVSAHGKHVLPVDSNCRFRHSRGMATSHTPCSFKDKSVPNSYEDMVRCIDEADCTFVDTHDQMAIFRDPRPVAVSSYFYLKVHGRIGPWEHATVDDFVLETFPIICQWVALRHILFEGILKRRTISFWYNDALADPTLWHRQLVGFLGLNLPEAVVEAASKATAEHRLSFKTKAIDKHPGGENATVSRSYVDEIKEETLIRLNEMLVLWMPPLIGHRLNKSTFSWASARVLLLFCKDKVTRWDFCSVFRVFEMLLLM